MTHGSPLGHRKLSFPRRIAVNELLAGATKREALTRAGYSSKYPLTMVFDREDVQQEMERLSQKAMSDCGIDRAWVTQQYVDIALADRILAKYKKIDINGKIDWDFTGATIEDLGLISGIATETDQYGVRRFKITTPDRLKALDSLCRIHGLNKDKLELDGELSLIERLQRGRTRAKVENDREIEK